MKTLIKVIYCEVVDGKTVYRNQDVNTMYEFYLKWKLAK